MFGNLDPRSQMCSQQGDWHLEPQESTVDLCTPLEWSTYNVKQHCGAPGWSAGAGECSQSTGC